MSEPSFAELLTRARQGDAAATDAIARQYERPLRIVASAQLGRLMRPYLDSIDLVQSVHRSLLVGLRQQKFDISTPENLIALALTMVRRKIARHWQRLQRQQRLDAGGDNGGNIPRMLADLSSPDSDPARVVQVEDAIQHLWTHLDPVEQKLIQLRLEGHSTAEVARALDLDANVLRVRLSRLRHRLQALGVLSEWL